MPSGLENMKTIEIYTKPYCGYCLAAKRLLTMKGMTFTEIDISRDTEQRQVMQARSNGRFTVPQIFIGEVHVGGYDELSALERSGKLDALLAA